jgi:hypothetical protein
MGSCAAGILSRAGAREDRTESDGILATGTATGTATGEEEM